MISRTSKGHGPELPVTVVSLAAFTLSACHPGEPQVDPSSEPGKTVEPALAEPVSILRDDMDARVAQNDPLEPLAATVPFAQGGTELSDEALSAIAAIVASRQFAQGGAITLRGHTDSAGHDEANLRASQHRAEAVARALEQAGADSQRISIVALGEMRPIAPNARLDGSPDEEGRARNRRVDVSIALPDDAAPASANMPADDDVGSPPS